MEHCPNCDAVVTPRWVDSRYVWITHCYPCGFHAAWG